MRQIGSIVENLYKRTVVIIFSAMIFGLSILSLVATCTMNDAEKTYFQGDHPLLHMLSIGAVVLLAAYGYRKNSGRYKIAEKKWLWVGSLLLMALGVIWVFGLRIKPGADQRYVLEVAKQLKQQDYSAFQKGGYVYIYPNQVGIILVFYFLSYLIGDYNYLALQCLNVICLVLSYYLMGKIAVFIFKERKMLLATWIGCTLFFPFFFYITFVYGNLMGFTLSMGAIYEMMRYRETREKKTKVTAMILCGICIGLAVLLKSNYLITFVGIVLVLGMDGIRERSGRSFLFAAVVIVLYIGLNIGSKAYITHLTGEQVSEGTPKLTWIAMGLQEGKRCSGWYNGFNKKVYEENQYNSEKAKEESMKALQESLLNYAKNPMEGVKFFGRKLASEWNNPTFQGFWISRSKANPEEKRWYTGILSGAGKSILMEYMNWYQSAILVGVCCYLVLQRKKEFRELVFMVIFIGGFLFHLLWEAKAQYTITYFILLIPYAIWGYYLLLLRKIIDFQGLPRYNKRG